MCVHPVQADDDRFKSSFKNCKNVGHGNTFCEMKCGTDYGAKEVAAKLNINI
ncbi:hypothetical protein CRYUN_Cryun14cG0103600 [Craigia yunnanensis]